MVACASSSQAKSISGSTSLRSSPCCSAAARAPRRAAARTPAGGRGPCPYQPCSRQSPGDPIGISDRPVDLQRLVGECPGAVPVFGAFARAREREQRVGDQERIADPRAPRRRRPRRSCLHPALPRAPRTGRAQRGQRFRSAARGSRAPRSAPHEAALAHRRTAPVRARECRPSRARPRVDRVAAARTLRVPAPASRGPRGCGRPTAARGRRRSPRAAPLQSPRRAAAARTPGGYCRVRFASPVSH